MCRFEELAAICSEYRCVEEEDKFDNHLSLANIFPDPIWLERGGRRIVITKVRNIGRVESGYHK